MIPGNLSQAFQGSPRSGWWWRRGYKIVIVVETWFHRSIFRFNSSSSSNGSCFVPLAMAATTNWLTEERSPWRKCHTTKNGSIMFDIVIGIVVVRAASAVVGIAVHVDRGREKIERVVR